VIGRRVAVERARRRALHRLPVHRECEPGSMPIRGNPGLRSWCSHVMDRHTRRTALLVAVVAMLATSCHGGNRSATRPTSSRPAAPSTGAPSSARVPPSAPSSPAAAALTIQGDPALSGAIANAEVTCSFPDVDGLRISVFGPAAKSPFSYRIAVAPEKVIVQADTGQGSTFRERNFEGTGVAGFDARGGVHIDAELTDAAPSPGVAPGSIGRITSGRGSISCGDQTPGSSNLTITGQAPTGRYDASPLDPVVVECYFGSEQVTAIGVAHAGATRTLMMVSLGTDGLGVEEALGAAGQRY